MGYRVVPIILVLVFHQLIASDRLLYADISLKFGTAAFEVNSGVQSIDLLAKSTSNDILIALTADFQLQQGSFALPAGTFGETGMIGHLNLQGASDFSRDTVVFSNAYLSLDFIDDQPISASFERIASLQIDTTGLDVGTYPLTFLGADAFGTSGSVNVQLADGSFEIFAAVPEPSGLLPSLSLLLLAIVLQRRRKYRDR